MIREMEAADIPLMMDEVEAFFGRHPITSKVLMSRSKVSEFLLSCIKAEKAKVFVCTRPDGTISGAIGGLCAPSIYTRSATALMEFMWWVAEDRRNCGDGIRLLRRLERWGSCMGATVAVIDAMSGGDLGGTSRALLGLGYDEVERRFARNLGE